MGSYMTTHYVVVLFVPVFPVARYRVISDGDSTYRFVGKGRFRMFEKVHMALAALGLLALVLAVRLGK